VGSTVSILHPHLLGAQWCVNYQLSLNDGRSCASCCGSAPPGSRPNLREKYRKRRVLRLTSQVHKNAILICPADSRHFPTKWAPDCKSGNRSSAEHALPLSRWTIQAPGSHLPADGTKGKTGGASTYLSGHSLALRIETSLVPHVSGRYSLLSRQIAAAEPCYAASNRGSPS